MEGDEVRGCRKGGDRSTGNVQFKANSCWWRECIYAWHSRCENDMLIFLRLCCIGAVPEAYPDAPLDHTFDFEYIVCNYIYGTQTPFQAGQKMFYSLSECL